jgi:hypothetical protein
MAGACDSESAACWFIEAQPPSPATPASKATRQAVRLAPP